MAGAADGLGPHLIDTRAPTPLYHQIYLILKERIRRGDFAAGEVLPGEEDLARCFEVSRITAKRALNDLADEQLVTRRRGRGTVVAGAASEGLVTGSFDTLVRSLERIGADTQVELLDVAEEKAAGEVARLLELEPGAPVRRINRLRRLEGEPFSYLVTYLPQAIAARITRRDLASKPMLRLLRQAGSEPAEAEQWITAAGAEPQVAAALGLAMGSPLLRVARVVRDAAATPIQLIYAQYHPERFAYHIQAPATPHEDENG
jgi:GntR family transcriptional regulator